MAENYTGLLLPIEQEFDSNKGMEWFQRNWKISLYASVVYVLFIYAATKFMVGREPYKLRLPLAVWSGILAVFSIVCTIRSLPEFYDSIFNRSFRFSVCNTRFQHDAPTAFWLHIYSFAKLIELGDTVFIVFRKQKLIFLHWYHHFTVLIYSYYGLTADIGVVRYFCNINMFVHALMYTYYTLRALRVYVPKWVNIVITMLQIIQMMVGFYVNIAAVIYQHQGHHCPLTPTVFTMTMLMYASYFVLFAQFFYNAYMRPKSGSKKLD